MPATATSGPCRRIRAHYGRRRKKLAREATQETKAREKALRDHFRSLLGQLMADYVGDDRGIEVREVAGGYRLATKPEYHDAVRGFVKSLKPPLKLSLQALETLAVVAYKQPVTAPEISEIRGVDSGARRPRRPDRPQAHHHRRPQTSHRPPHSVQNHQGFPRPLRPQGHQRAAQHRRV